MIHVRLLAVSLTCLLLTAAGPAAKPVDTLDAVVKAAVAAGFPDAAGAKVYRGNLRVSATFDPTKGTPPLPTDASGMQETIPGQAAVKYGFQFDGVHFKLADGSWVIALRYHFKPDKGGAVDASGAAEVDVAKLTADAAADGPAFDPDKMAGKYLADIPAESKEKSKKALTVAAPVSRYLHMGFDDFAPALVLLRQAGWSDADQLAQAIADTRARSYWQLKPWTTPDAPFDPTGEYPTQKQEEADWKKGHVPYAAEPPVTAVRRAIFRWSRAQLGILDAESAMLKPATAAAVAKAAVDPADPQQNGPRIDDILAMTKIPVEPQDEAKLADKLMSWESRPRRPKMAVTGGGASISTSFDAPAPAYKPDKADLDELVALLADDRPSRCVDFSGDRTVGDNAWRAAAELLKSDPRKLAKYPTDKPWTAAERHAAANAVQTWWKSHRTEYVEK